MTIVKQCFRIFWSIQKIYVVDDDLIKLFFHSNQTIKITGPHLNMSSTSTFICFAVVIYVIWKLGTWRLIWEMLSCKGATCSWGAIQHFLSKSLITHTCAWLPPHPVYLSLLFSSPCARLWVSIMSTVQQFFLVCSWLPVLVSHLFLTLPLPQPFWILCLIIWLNFVYQTSACH